MLRAVWEPGRFAQEESATSQTHRRQRQFCSSIGYKRPNCPCIPHGVRRPAPLTSLDLEQAPSSVLEHSAAWLSKLSTKIPCPRGSRPAILPARSSLVTAPCHRLFWAVTLARDASRDSPAANHFEE